MAKPELTKQLLADTLKELMYKRPIERISIHDIVTECGLNRKTFYYHFKDKQELLCWIFDREYASIQDRNNNNSIIDELLEHLYQNKDFYVAALTSDAQNNLREHFHILIRQSIETMMDGLLGNRKISPVDAKQIGNYFANAVVSTVTQWAKEGMRTSPSEYGNFLFSITNDCLGYIVFKAARQQ